MGTAPVGDAMVTMKRSGFVPMLEPGFDQPVLSTLDYSDDLTNNVKVLG